MPSMRQSLLLTGQGAHYKLYNETVLENGELYGIFIIKPYRVYIVFNSTFCAESLLPGFANVAATIMGKTAVASQYT